MTLQSQETEPTISLSEKEEISYVETRKFQRATCIETKRLEYPSSEAYSMYLKVVQKYKATKDPILICLRDKDDGLVKSELLNYK